MKSGPDKQWFAKNSAKLCSDNWAIWTPSIGGENLGECTAIAKVVQRKVTLQVAKKETK